MGRRHRSCQDSGNGAAAASCGGYFISAPRVQDVHGVRRHSQIGNCSLLQRAPLAQDAAQKSTCLVHRSPSRPRRTEHINHWKSPISTLQAQLWTISLSYLVITTLPTISHLHAPETEQQMEKYPKMKAPYSPAASMPGTKHARLPTNSSSHTHTDSPCSSAEAFLIQTETKASDFIPPRPNKV